MTSPETSELYTFNMYGQHVNTLDIHTGVYMYNFTYNVFSSYGRLTLIEDSAGNKVSSTKKKMLVLCELC